MTTLEDLIADLRAQADNPNIAPWIRITLRSSSVVCQQLQLAKLQIQQNTDEIRRENDRLNFMKSQEEFMRNQEEYARKENERLSHLKSHEEFMKDHDEYMRNNVESLVEKQKKLSISGDEGFAENRTETFITNTSNILSSSLTSLNAENNITSVQTDYIETEYLGERSGLLLENNTEIESLISKSTTERIPLSENTIDDISSHVITASEGVYSRSLSNSVSMDPVAGSFARSDSFASSLTQEYAQLEKNKNDADETIENGLSTANDVISFDCTSNYSESFLHEEEVLGSRINEVELFGLANTTSTIGKENVYYQDEVLTEKTLDDSILDSIYDEDRFILDMELNLDPIKSIN